MSNVQISLLADGAGIDPAWRVIRSEREDDKNARVILSNEISRRLSTRPGTYFTKPSYGVDIENLLGSAITTDAINRLALEIEAQCVDDERILKAKCSITSVASSGENRKLKMSLVLVPRIGEQFALTLAISGVTVSVLKGG